MDHHIISVDNGTKGIELKVHSPYEYLSFHIYSNNQKTLYSIGSYSTNPRYATLQIISKNSTSIKQLYFLIFFYSFITVIIEYIKLSSIRLLSISIIPFPVNLLKYYFAVSKSSNPLPNFFFSSSNILSIPFMLSNSSSLNLYECLINFLNTIQFDFNANSPK